MSVNGFFIQEGTLSPVTRTGTLSHFTAPLEQSYSEASDAQRRLLWESSKDNRGADAVLPGAHAPTLRVLLPAGRWTCGFLMVLRGSVKGCHGESWGDVRDRDVTVDVRIRGFRGMRCYRTDHGSLGDCSGSNPFGVRRTAFLLGILLGFIVMILCMSG